MSLLKQQVSEILTGAGVPFEIEAFPSAEALLDRIAGGPATFDLFLLDIYMKQVNGVDAARSIRASNDSAAIIFTTASARNVFAGYEVQALQYLLKPIDPQALSAAVMVDVKRRFENRYFVFKVGATTQKVPYDEIEYLESTLKSVRLVTAQGVYQVYDQISNLENSLPRLSFCRCHRGFIVNLKQVSRMNAQSLATARGTVIPIGKTYAKATSRAFLNYISGAGD